MKNITCVKIIKLCIYALHEKLSLIIWLCLLQLCPGISVCKFWCRCLRVSPSKQQSLLSFTLVWVKIETKFWKHRQWSTTSIQGVMKPLCVDDQFMKKVNACFPREECKVAPWSDNDTKTFILFFGLVCVIILWIETWKFLLKEFTLFLTLKTYQFQL